MLFVLISEIQVIAKSFSILTLSNQAALTLSFQLLAVEVAPKKYKSKSWL
jgi:hypothetical protein